MSYVLELPNLTDYRGREYRNFYARRDPGQGPGWFVFGRSIAGEYGGHLIARIAHPDTARRKHPHYNREVQSGFRTLREARTVAETLNRLYPHTAKESV